MLTPDRQWVTAGYNTLLTETDEQVSHLTNGSTPNLVFASVGVGSWAQAVVTHYSARTPTTTTFSLPPQSSARIMTVEPSTAPSFKEALHCGTITPIQTGDTIMCGMNCGTTSSNAWPIMRAGTYAAVAVGDREAHECVLELQAEGVDAGPCGAATLAALRKLCAEGVLTEEERKGVVVVLFSTEGNREYDVPEP